MHLRLLIEDSFLSSFPASGNAFLIAQAMRMFSYPDWILSISMLAATAGAMLCAVFGYALRRTIRHAVPDEAVKLAKAESIAQKWSFLGLLLAWMPIGQVVVFFAGFLRMPWWQMLLWITLGQLGFHVWLWRAYP